MCVPALSSLLRSTSICIPKLQESGSGAKLDRLGVRARGIVDDLVGRSSFVHGRFNARERTLKDINFGGLYNEGTVLEYISCGYEASRE